MRKEFIISLIAVLAVSVRTLGVNLIVNGDFEIGSIAPSTSQYTLITSPGPEAMWEAKTFAIGFSPSNYHMSWNSYSDHTRADGKGNMLIVNAADSGLPVVWEQTVLNITPGTDYEFSYYIALSYSLNPPLLQCLINGFEIGRFDASSAKNGSVGWTHIAYKWNSDYDTSATIQLLDLNPVWDGDDYALDDISLFDSFSPDKTQPIIKLINNVTKVSLIVITFLLPI
jgi:hypothetical protein